MVLTTTRYKGYVLKLEKMKSGYWGVLAFKNGEPKVVSSGHQQYIGVGKNRSLALEDAKKAIDGFRNI